MIFNYLEILKVWRMHEDNVTLSNNLLLNSYFKNSTIGLHVLYVLNMHTNIPVNQLLFTIQFINSSFMHYFKLQKLEFK